MRIVSHHPLCHQGWTGSRLRLETDPIQTLPPILLDPPRLARLGSVSGIPAPGHKLPARGPELPPTGCTKRAEEWGTGAQLPSCGR